MSVNALQHLIGVPLFAGLSPEAVASLAAHTRIQSFVDGDTIVEIDQSTPLFVVLEGRVQVADQHSPVDSPPIVLGPRERFGDRSLLDGELRKTRIVASEDVQLLLLEQSAFRDVVAETPEVALQIIENLSAQMGRADELIRDLSDTAMRDVLTGILNRRAYEERLGEEVDRSLRYSEHFSLILTDLDHFKSINYTYGHATGDVVLRWVGRLLTEHTRSPDTPFRIGGEEFAILAPSTNMEVARHVAQRLVDVLGRPARPWISTWRSPCRPASLAAPMTETRRALSSRWRIRPFCGLKPRDGTGCAAVPTKPLRQEKMPGRLAEPTGHNPSPHHPSHPSLRIGRRKDSKGCIGASVASKTNEL